MHVIVQEMHQSDMDSGGHIWVDLHFNSGRVVTVRVDEFVVMGDENQARVFLRREEIGNTDTVGKEVFV